MFYRVIYSLGKVISTGSPQLFNVFCTYQNFAIFTSNHNFFRSIASISLLSNITFLHQTTTTLIVLAHYPQLSNITFLHQTTTRHGYHQVTNSLSNITFLHQTTTIYLRLRICWQLSNITFLHQTTTFQQFGELFNILSNITFLHQTTTREASRCTHWNCQISLFYIKPQRKQLRFIFVVDCQISLFYIKPQLIP